MTTHFKLIQREGFTRRLTFPNKPTWHTLAAKIESLYAIPLDKVSVAYVDADDDEVTLSTQEELDDFYQSSHQPGQTIKFIIQDLSSTRVQSNAQFTNPVSNLNIRDTFGGEGFDIDDDWQPLPPFTGVGGMFAPRASGAESPHAFVEVVGSDADLISTQHETNIDNETDTVQSVTGDRTSPLNKGKERAVADDSSTCSVLAEYTPAKPPVHVYDRNSCDKDAISASSGHGPTSTLGTPHSPPVPIHTESAPKVATQASADRENNTSQDAQTAPNSPNEAADPPLPSLESATAPSTSPSLCNDVAALLTSFMSTVNEHPELAEGVRNIIRNTAGGTYWNTHRQAMSHATAELIQTNDEIRRRAEEEAGRNVADALGTMFQALSQTLGPIDAGSSQATPASPEGGSARHPEQPVTANSTSFWYGTPEANVRPSLNRPSGPAHHPPHGPFPNPWMRRGPFGPARGAWGSWYTPTPPMPPPRGTTGHRHGPPPPPPPGPPGHQQGPLPPLPPLAAPFLGSWEPEAPIPLGPTPVTNTSRVNPTPDESKAKVDAARLRYKAEKGRYRQEREERKKERERKTHTTGGNINQNVEMRTVPRPQDNLTAGPSNTQPAAIVSNGRGDYPTIELVSVHRNHTHPGHGSSARRNLFEHGDVKSRTLNRISRRLADMGFTDNAYPDLLGKIKEQMPSSGVVSKEAEDDIVTTLLEELLAAPPRPPVPSGSNGKDTNIPGAWH